MQKIIDRWWVLWVAGMLMGVWAWGVKNMYFHQDDLDWFILANRPLAQILSAPIGDHINYLWRLLLSVEWQLFGLFYPGYFLISLAIHTFVIWLLYKIACETSGRKDLAANATLLFTINTNWIETVLWISGQTISVTALIVLLAIRQVWRKRGELITIVMACTSSALALGLPMATFFVYKKQRWAMVTLLVIIVLIYLWRGGDGTSLAVSLAWLGQVMAVWGLMPINTVIGRLLVPFDKFELLRIGLVVFILIYGLWKWRQPLGKVWSDAWSRFLLLHMGFYYLIVALGRAQYGVGIMRAERYGYLGLALLLILLVRLLRHARLGKWIWTIPLVVLVQCFGLYHRATNYVERPQQLREVVERVKMDPSKVDPDAYLPYYVLNDERLKYGDLLKLIND